MGEEKPKKKVQAIVKMARSPARDYVQPLLHKIATEIIPEDSAFIPQYQSNPEFVDLISATTVKLFQDDIATIDCGFTMKLSSGYKVVITAIEELAKLGLCVVSSSYQGRVKVVVTNIGIAEVTINHGDRFAQMRLEPVYLFDWILSEPSGFGQLEERG